MVDDSSYARTYLAWADLSALRPLAHLPRWSSLVGIASDLVAFEPQLTTKTKIDVLAADSTIEIGQPPNNADRLDGPGVNAAAISRALLSLGAKRERAGARTFLAFGAEHSVSLTGPLGGLSTGTLDRSLAAGHTFATGPAVAPVEAILGGGRSLSSNPDYGAAGACLGDVLSAVILPISQVLPATGRGLIAIGDRRPASANGAVTEVLCTVGSTPSSAAAQLTRLRAGLRPSGLLPSEGGLGRPLPTRQIVSSAAVGRSDRNGLAIVRGLMTLRPAERAGYLYDLLQSGQLGSLL